MKDDDFDNDDTDDDVIKFSLTSFLTLSLSLFLSVFLFFDYDRYFTFKNRKYSIEAEYIENVRTPTHKS